MRGFLSTLSLRRATSQQPDGTTRTTYFYPRSPCGERHLRVLDGSKSSIISIHALLAESDNTQQRHFPKHPQFLSTLSLRRATKDSLTDDVSTGGFLSTLSLRRATLTGLTCGGGRNISIHALLAESDVWPGRLARPFFIISIHALLAESDCGRRVGLPVAGHFYPRSPCGERLERCSLKKFKK